MASLSSALAGIGGILSLPIIKYVMNYLVDDIDPMTLYLDVLEGTAGVIALGALADVAILLIVRKRSED